MNLKILTFLLLIFIYACQPNDNADEDNVLARVNDSYLYESELMGLVPAGTSASDSLILVKNFISNWIKNRTLIDKAEKNLTDEQKDFKKLINDYRNSLLIFEYEKKLLARQLDTIISDQEAKSYYDEFRGNFLLKEKLYRVRHIKISEDYPEQKITSFFKDTAKAARDSLYKILDGASEGYNIEKGRWYTKIELKKEFPVIMIHADEKMKAGDCYEFNDELFLIMVNFSSVCQPGEISPYEYIAPQIKQIILNKRKSMFLKNIKKQILEQAISNNEVEIY